jgi:hypothetical protein
MELYANNIKIPFGGVLNLKFFNPLFNDVSAYSLPVSFNGKIAAVKRAFGYADKQEASAGPLQRGIDGRIKTSFIDLIGAWGVDEASGENISAYFKPGSGDFYSLIKEKLLSDIDFGGIKYPTGQVDDPWGDLLTIMNGKVDTTYPESEYAAFCAYMPNANGDNTMLTSQFVNPGGSDDEGNWMFGGLGLPYPRVQDRKKYF